MRTRYQLVAGRPLPYLAVVLVGVLVFAGAAANRVGARADVAPLLPAGTYCQGPQPSQPAAGPTHVLNIVLENVSAVTVDASPDAPFQNGTLNSQCGTFGQGAMHSTAHGSESNYFALASGLNPTITSGNDAQANFGLSDCPPSATTQPPSTSCKYGTGHIAPTTPSIYSLVEQRYGVTGWKSYSDDMPSNCLGVDANLYATDSDGKTYRLYVTRHNPAVYFYGPSCATQDVPSGDWRNAQGALYTDLMSGAMPYYSFVQPNDIENGHDPTTVTGKNGVTTTIAGGTSQIGNIDSYLSTLMATVQQSPQYQDGSLVVLITYDEGAQKGAAPGEGAITEPCADPGISPLALSCQIKTWVVGRYITNASYAGFANHFTLVAAMQRLLGLPPLLAHAGDAATADIVDGTAASPDPFNLAATTATPAVPSAPTSVTATAGNASASVAFTAPFATGGAPITSYTVTASPGGMTGSGSASPIAVVGLTNDTPYTFTVTGTNSVGPGAASAASASVTPTAAPPPTELLGDPGFESGNGGWVAFRVGTLSRVTSPVHGGSDALRVASPSTSASLVGLTQNSVISNSVAGRAYTASCYVQPTSGSLNVAIRWLEYTQNYGSVINLQNNLTNALPLATWTLVQVTSTAVNSGERMIPQVYSTNQTSTNGSLVYDDCSVTAASGTTSPTAPSAPTGVSATAGVASAAVSFVAPNANGSPISGYTVTSSPGNVTGSGTSSPITVSGLTDGTAYTFTVTATNGIGTGASSAPSNAATPRTTPSAPTAVLATAGDGSASVAFNGPTTNGGAAITSYTVTANPGTATGTGTTSPITVSGLTNGTSYTFTVTATNAAGPGPASAPSNSVTPVHTATTQLLPDPGFESGTGGWVAFKVGTLTRVGAPVHGGAFALQVAATASTTTLVGLTQNSAVNNSVAARAYTASCYVQPTSSGALIATIRLLEYTQNFASNAQLQVVTVNTLPLNTWTLVQVTGVALRAGERIIPQIYSTKETTTTGNLIYDDCSLTSN